MVRNSKIITIIEMLANIAVMLLIGVLISTKISEHQSGFGELIFWIFWIILTCVLVYRFYYLDKYLIVKEKKI